MTRPMDHTEATSANRLERYMLNELAGEERDAFEEHYFSCAICAQDIVVTARFIDNARKPLLKLDTEAPAERPTGAQPPLQPARPENKQGESWWERWLDLAPKPALALACMALLAVVVYREIPGGARGEVMGSYFVTSARAVDTEPRKIRVQKKQERIALLYNRTDPSVARYAFVLESAGGSAVLQFEGDAPRDTDDVIISLPVKGMAPGRYTLRVRDASARNELAAIPFELLYP
ncbi:MAG: zf-HC2 domain-containing protein [Acidobacteria bacterium]|nr:zf-HC2 domain-containing protein [Acidobacteriota bacterium]